MKVDITTCPNCKVEFPKKRKNQRYCSQKCRMQFNNEKYDLKGSKFKEINGYLRRNFRIIMKLLGDDKSATVDKTTLLKKGFTFEVFTHHEMVDGLKHPLPGIYDYYYYRLDNKNFKFFRI